MHYQAPNLIARIQAGKGVGSTAGVMTLAVFGLIADVMGDLAIVLLTILLSIAVGFVVAYVRGKTKQLPSSIISEICENSYSARFCTVQNLQEACDMTKPLFGRDYVGAERALQWHTKNPASFVAITNSSGELCAFFGILALRQSFMEQFLKGALTESDLIPTDVLSLEDAKKSSDLYISGVVVRDVNSLVSGRRVAVMVWAILMYMKSVYGLRKTRRLFALAVTEESEQFMRELGFEIAGNRDRRKDRRDLFMYQMNGRKSWEELHHKISDWSNICTCHYKEKADGG